MFLRLSALAGAAFVAAQLFQRWVGFRLPAPATPAEDALQRVMALDQWRLTLVGASLGLLVLPYMAVYLRTRAIAPAAALLGLLAGCGFVGFELAYRSVDLLVVSQRWAPALVAGTMSVDRLVSWDELVRAWYLPLLVMHGVSAAAFASAVAARRQAGDGWLAVALAANAVRAFMRSLQMHGGIAVLAPLNAAIYLPVTLGCYGGLAWWLASEARRDAGGG